MMKRAKDDTRSRDSGPGETPQRTDIFLERSKTVPIRLSVSESSNAQIFASATIPQKFKFLISDRMLLLFLAQAVLSACGGGGGGGGGDKPGPVFRGNTAPLPAKTESTPPEPATEAERPPPNQRSNLCQFRRRFPPKNHRLWNLNSPLLTIPTTLLFD